MYDWLIRCAWIFAGLYSAAQHTAAVHRHSSALCTCLCCTAQHTAQPKSEVIRTPTDDFGDHHTNQLIQHSYLSTFTYGVSVCCMLGCA